MDPAVLLGDQGKGTPTETARLAPPLPHVVWRCIAVHLSDSLSTLFHIASFSRDLQEICRPHISSHFQRLTFPVAPLPSDFYYHRLVQLVLEGYIDPSLIFEIYRWADYSNRAPYEQLITAEEARRLLNNKTNADEIVTAHPTRKCDRLLREAVEESAFISTEMKSEVCKRFQQGDPDAALAILLPLCTKLKTLEIYGSSTLCGSVFEAVARAYHHRGTNAEEARYTAREAARDDRGGWSERKTPTWNTLPFSELLVIVVDGSPLDGRSSELLELVPFTGIPTLHRIYLSAVRDHTFPGWPADSVVCSCPEIYLQDATVTRHAALEFAKGVHAPCEIRQWYHSVADGNALDSDLQLHWDHVLIRPSLDGSKTITAGFAFVEGSPGYDDAWISCPWRGMMQNWEQLHEEFSVQKGDYDGDVLDLGESM